ncbi:MAG: transcriptional activator NhaR [Bryobacterales bacterium]|nr:transcriptional activator NhaR [Bryobacterales bacterium]
MAWLNYHHLLYFWTVAKEGSVAKACERLHLAQPTISGQLKQLEETLGEKLFTKAGRGLALTEVGRLVFQYAEEIFGLGEELQSVLKGGPRKRPQRIVVGVSDMVPKLIAYRILQPVLNMADAPKLLCEEDSPERLLADLMEHRLDVVLSDSPITVSTRQRAYNHLLGTCGVTLFGTAALAERYRRKFPQSLNGAPLLLPRPGSNLRRSMDRWFEAHGVRPLVAGEFKDSALMKAFGQAGAGLFPGARAIEKEIREHYRAKVVGQLDTVTESYYAISIERKLKHPAVSVICEAARGELFAPAQHIA